MTPKKRGASIAVETPPTPNQDPFKDQGAVDVPRRGTLAHSTTSSTHWRYSSRTFHARDVVTDTIAAILFTAIIVALILLSCLLAWVAS